LLEKSKSANKNYYTVFKVYKTSWSHSAATNLILHTSDTTVINVILIQFCRSSLNKCVALDTIEL